MNSLHLSFCLTSTVFNHEQLSGMFDGISMEDVVIHGTSLSPDRFVSSPNTVSINSKIMASSTNYEDHWSFIASRLPPLRGGRPFPEGVTPRLEIRGVFDTHRPLIEISARTLAAMAGYGLEVGYDIYDVCE